jgi:hypothetical protein
LSRIYLKQASFSRGEFSPKLHDRTDLEHYRLGLAYARNFIGLRHGGITRRPPTEFIARIKDSSKQARLVPFVYNAEQAYILEFSEFSIRVYKNDGAVLDGSDFVDIPTPFSEADCQELDYSQSADVLYIAHKSHYPMRLTRWSHTEWDLSTVNFIDGPWLAKNAVSNKATPSGNIVANQSTTVSFESVSGVNDGAGWQTKDVGRYFRWQSPDDASTTGQEIAWGQITAVNSGANITVLWLGSAALETASGITIINNTSASDNWWAGAFYSPGGYPHKVAFYSERLCWARSDDLPQNIWMSMAGKFENHATTDRDGAVANDHAIPAAINAGEVNEIMWLAEGSNLQIGTKSATRSISSTDSDTLGPDNIEQNRESSYGSADVRPVQVGSATLYAGAFGSELREMVYSYESDGFVTPDASVLSEHMLAGRIKEMAYAQAPNSIIWMCLQDGTLVSLTYERDQQTVGWMQHEGLHVESVAVIPGDDRHEVWLLVRREINGQTRRYIERLREPFEPKSGSDVRQYANLDSQATYSGALVSTVTGANHLEGEIVGVLADGADIGDAVVTDGAVDLPLEREASEIIIGKRYTSIAKTLPAAFQARDGDARGRRVTVKEAFVSYLEMTDLEVGTEIGAEFAGDSLLGRPFTDTTVVPAEVETGVARVDITDSWENQGQVVIKAGGMHPATIRSINIGIEVEP